MFLLLLAIKYNKCTGFCMRKGTVTGYTLKIFELNCLQYRLMHWQGSLCRVPGQKNYFENLSPAGDIMAILMDDA